MNKLGTFVFLLVLFLLLLFLNWYVYQGVKTLLAHLPGNQSQRAALIYWMIMSCISIWVMLTFLTIIREGRISPGSQQRLNLFLTVTVTQLTIVLFLFGEDIFRGIETVYNYFHSFHSKTPENLSMIPGRRKFVSQIALGIAAIPFAGFIYGIFKGKYHFRVIRETLYFEDLPEAFDGFTITQLSDIHAGSFTDFEAVQRGVDLASEQDSDLFVFTGDLVNHKAEEIDPMLDQFGKLRARFGQYSILGNHDYGDYISWSNKEAKEANFNKLKQQHQRLGYQLLLDESKVIEKDGQKIRLIGVENWGVGFHAKGDLDKALQGVAKDEFKILLSHDPSHWDEKVKNHPHNIHLTLSGHTHGMQFGIETPVIKWSPAQYRYPNWAGLAKEAGRYLYVNRGFGFHAFSGRVGIWPEITVLTLRKA
jgi:predicted MPP superfamily phosphohydrolase